MVLVTAQTLAMSLSVNCLLLGDHLDRMFTVEILKNKTVGILKKLIKEENPSSLGNVDVKNIDLWHVSFPIDDLETELRNINLDHYPTWKLSSTGKKLTTFFTDAADDCLHVIESRAIDQYLSVVTVKNVK
jgi:hypothetical protein